MIEDTQTHAKSTEKRALTTEQREILLDMAFQYEEEGYGDGIPANENKVAKTIRSVLSQSVPAWSVTKERQEALKGLIEHCRLNGNPDTSMLQVMLAEVPK